MLSVCVPPKQSPKMFHKPGDVGCKKKAGTWSLPHRSTGGNAENLRTAKIISLSRLWSLFSDLKKGRAKNWNSPHAHAGTPPLYV